MNREYCWVVPYSQGLLIQQLPKWPRFVKLINIELHKRIVKKGNIKVDNILNYNYNQEIETSPKESHYQIIMNWVG